MLVSQQLVRFTTRRGLGTGDRADRGDAHRPERGGRLLALGDDDDLSVPDERIVDAVERERRRGDASKPLLPVALPPHLLRAIGQVETDVLEDLIGVGAIGEPDPIPCLVTFASRTRRSRGPVRAQEEVGHIQPGRRHDRLDSAAGVAAGEGPAIVTPRQAQARVPVLVRRAPSHPARSGPAHALEPVEQTGQGVGGHHGSERHDSRSASAR